jgi:pimeloyl-ACP methyl ester carboxylesterase
VPYPEQLTSSADAVVQYALSLGFKLENIILYSWSIGGFTISWLTNQYPEVKAAILDACFDDIVHLAQQQMPQFACN